MFELGPAIAKPWGPMRLMAAPGDAARALPSDWVQQAGEYVGAWFAGSALGYVVSRDDGIAFRTGLATSSIRNLGDVVIHRKDYPVWYLFFLGLTGTASLIYVWGAGRRGRKA